MIEYDKTCPDCKTKTLDPMEWGDYWCDNCKKWWAPEEIKESR